MFVDSSFNCWQRNKFVLFCVFVNRMKWGNTDEVQEGTRGLIWINSTLHSQVIHGVVLLYWDMRKQNHSSASVTLRKTDSVAGLYNRAVSRDNHTLLLHGRQQRRAFVMKVQLPMPRWFDQKINTQMSGAKSHYFPWLCNCLLAYMHITSATFFYCLLKEKKKYFQKPGKK